MSTTLPNTLSWDEYEQLKTELYTLHRQLGDYETRLLEHTRVSSSMHNVRVQIDNLIRIIRTTDLIN